MAKLIYVGDPTLNADKKPLGTNKSGEVTYRNPVDGETVTFVEKMPTECPAWLAPRLSKNTHFKLIDDKPLGLK